MIDIKGRADRIIQYQGPAEQGARNILHPRRELRRKWPNTYQLPGILRPGESRHHRDVMQRPTELPFNDYYLSPWDGHLAKLYVQSTQAIYDADPNSTWRRTHIRNQSPLMLQVANWVLHSIPKDREATGEELAIMGLKWIPACAALLFLVSSYSP